MQNFWEKLKRPFTVLAPMDGVTDVVFREIINQVGRPDVFFTEFTSTDGLISEGQKMVLKRLRIFPNENPVVAQIWGNNPENYYKSAKIIKKLGFAGIDINTGCPAHDVVKKGCCGALIKTPELVKELLEATRKGAGDLPVSIKTRIGFNKEIIDDWIVFLLKQNLPVLTVHLRTVSEMSKVPAHWELMAKIVKLRDQISPNTLIIGNGDITSQDQMDKLFKETGCDGFMVGRGIFQNPWIFNQNIKEEEITKEDRINLFLKHINLFEKVWAGTRNPAILNKFCKTYINNFPNAVTLRENLMKLKTTEELKAAVIKYQTNGTID